MLVLLSEEFNLFAYVFVRQVRAFYMRMDRLAVNGPYCDEIT